jgi:hypothetical protein
MLSNDTQQPQPKAGTLEQLAAVEEKRLNANESLTVVLCGPLAVHQHEAKAQRNCAHHKSECLHIQEDSSVDWCVTRHLQAWQKTRRTGMHIWPSCLTCRPLCRWNQSGGAASLKLRAITMPAGISTPHPIAASHECTCRTGSAER